MRRAPIERPSQLRKAKFYRRRVLLKYSLGSWRHFVERRKNPQPGEIFLEFGAYKATQFANSRRMMHAY